MLNWIRETLCGATAGIAIAAAVGASPAVAESAADYPSKPVRIVVAKSPGGVDDTTARLLANFLQPVAGQPIVIENKGGASGIIGTSSVIKADPDGYTFLFINLASQIVAGAVKDPQPYDPLTDFTPVALVATYKNVLVANTSVPGETLADFAAYAKERPGELAYGSGGVGSLNQLAILILMRDLGMDLVHVPYKGGGEASLGLNSNQVQLYYTDTNTALTTVQLGHARILAQTGSERSSLMPDVPLMSEVGIPALQRERALGLIAPPGTPAEIVDKMNALVNKALADPKMAERAAQIGVQVPAEPLNAAGFADLVKSDVDTWVPIARATMGK